MTSEYFGMHVQEVRTPFSAEPTLADELSAFGEVHRLSNAFEKV